MELKDGILVISDDEKNILNSDVGKKWLADNNFMIEKTVEKEKVLTDDIVKDYLNKNQSMSDKLYNENSMKFLKSKLGKDVNIDDLGKEIIFKDDLNNLKKEAIKTAVTVGLNTMLPKHSKLLINAIDFSKLDIKDNSLVGFDDELNSLKTTYPDLFETKVNSNTPPALPNNSKHIMTKDEFKKLPYEKRIEIFNNDKETYDKLSK